ncbi:MAG: translocation/assembly module TamB domain-containing protein [Acidobacteriota bacterium]|nr:translocation/assembly module TamB domain-containing protein [Acidobacteriota bacterium]
MTSRRRIWLRRLLIALGLVVLVAGLALGWLLGTSSGARWLFAQSGTLIPGKVTVGSLQGPIRGPLVLEELRYSTDTLTLTAQRVELEWRLRELLAKRLDITRLYARGIEITTVDEDEEPSPLPDVRLPINIIVRDAVVESLTVSGEPPVIIDRIELETTAAGSEVVVDRLEVMSPDLDLLASGRVEPVGEYPVDLEVQWSARLPDLPPLAAEGTLGGDLERLLVSQRLSRPVALTVDGTLTTPLRDLAFELQTAFEGLDPEAPDLQFLELDLPLTDLTGELRLEGVAEDFRLQGRLAATVPEDAGDLGRLSSELDVGIRSPGQGAPMEVSISSARVRPAGGAGSLDVRGDVVLEEAARFDLALAWEGLQWPLTPGAPEEVVVTTPQGSATIAGTAEEYRLTAEARLEGPQIPSGSWSLAGTGDLEGLNLRPLEGEVLGGRLGARGRFAWSPQVLWDLQVRGQGFDPAVQWPELPGTVAFTADTRGRLEEQGPEGRVQNLRLTGTVRGEPLEAQGAVVLAGGQVRLDPLEATWGGASAQASGLTGGPWDLTWSLEVPQVASLLPDLAGSLSAQGTLRGDAELPRLEAQLEASDLAFGEIRSQGLEVELEGDLAGGAPLRASVEATELLLAGRSWAEAEARLEGAPDQHGIEISAVGNDGVELAARLQGGAPVADWPSLLSADWSGEVQDLSYAAQGAGRWVQRSAADLAIEPLGGPSEGSQTVRLEELCLEAAKLPPTAADSSSPSSAASIGTSRLCVEGALQSFAGNDGAGEGGTAGTTSWQAEGTLSAVPLGFLSPFLPPEADLEGSVEGDFRLALEGSSPLEAEVRLDLSPGVLRYQLDDLITSRFGAGTARLTAGAGGIEGELQLPLEKDGQIQARFSAGAWSPASQELTGLAVKGSLDAVIQDLTWLPAVLPDLADTGGRLRAEATLSGTLGSPALAGEVRLEEAKARIPTLGIQVQEITFLARGDGGETLQLEGSAKSGDGTVRLQGTAGSAVGSAPVKVSLKGQDFQVMNTSEIQVEVSPDLEISVDGQDVTVRGEVTVPEAEIAIKKLEEGAVHPSPDVVVVSGKDGEEQVRTAAGPLRVDARVRLVLGEDVEVEALGLTAEPEGTLLLTQTPNGLTRGSGELDISGGKYEAYGQDLDIERGRLIFGGGAVSNPGLDLRASRTAQDGTVAGVEVRGTLEEPEVTLWSNPAMGESDQLAYLLLGRPLESAGEAEGDLLTKAATSLGLKGGNLLAAKLGTRFGLEEARIETNGGLEEASLVVGKYLSPDLYVAYGIGLFEPVSTFRIRYLLSSKWSLEAETGIGTSADFLYSIERGGKKRESSEESGEKE